MLFHTGQRALFPLVEGAVGRLIPVDRLRWLTFGHLEADECESMNLWLAAAPNAQVAHGKLGCRLSVNDLADRPPRTLQDGEVINLGNKSLRRIETTHVPQAGTRGSILRRRPRPSWAVTCSLRPATPLPLPNTRSPVQPLLLKIASEGPV